VVLFILLNSFHLIPHILAIFSFGSDVSASVFSEKTIISRGLDYFTAIAPSVKVSIGLLGLAQLRELTISSFGFIIFPSLILSAFLQKKNKLLLLTGVFFLIITFFATANVSDLGFAIYKALFYIPGFKMFRNYFAQWSFAQIFFYTLLFGQSLAIVLETLKVKKRYLLIIFVFLLICVKSWPLVSGRIVNAINFQTDNSKIVVQIDPGYKKVLNFVQNYTTDGRVLSFPLTGPGYQELADNHGGAYVGPPTFSYLVGRADFSGYESLYPFNEILLHAVKDKNYQLFNQLLGLLNIRYIFHNSDVKIYDDTFKGFPYDYVKDFLPKDQESYKEFISKLPFDSQIDFGENYHFYHLPDTVFLPHIFSTTSTTYTTDPLNFQFIGPFNKERRSAVFGLEAAKAGVSDIYLEAENANPLTALFKNEHLHQHDPFISLRPDYIYYPLALLREKFDLWRVRNNHDRFVDLTFYNLSKRIGELNKYGDKMPVLKTEWKDPTIWKSFYPGTYYSWESTLSRYENGSRDFISWINNSTEPDNWKQAVRIKLKEQLYQHRTTIVLAIKNSVKKQEDKEYLLQFTNKLFDNLIGKEGEEVPDSKSFPYIVRIPKEEQGLYEVYMENKDMNDTSTTIEFEGSLLRPTKVLDTVTQFGTVTSNRNETKFYLHASPKNIVTDDVWQSSGEISKEASTSELNVYSLNGNRGTKIAKDTGILKEIHGLEPGKQYLISFDYQTFGDDFIFSLYERYYKDDTKKTLIANNILERMLNSNAWKNHQAIFTASLNTEYGVIQFTGSSGKLSSKIQIKNLSVTEIMYPKIFLKKVSEKKVPTIAPKITFTKINPTKYQIHVMDAKDPYTLVFLESFNVNWELTNPQEKSADIKGKISRLAGSIGKILVGVFIKNTPKEEITDSHFNGYVKEGMRQNIFLEPDTFARWGKKAVAQNKHFRVNGYANAWNIDSSDTDGKTDYTLILEVGTQKQFYVFLLTSLLTAFLLFLFSLIHLFKKNAKSS
jgi:hypothetical protein